PFTGIDYVTSYKEIAPNAEIHFSNDPASILEFTKEVLVSSIHTRERAKQAIENAGASKVYGLDDILNNPIGDSGYNEEYGLLGSNLSDDKTVKLFPRNNQEFVEELQNKLIEYSGKQIEVMIN
ncbi:coenzyme F420-0:L-glutamate ligase, partial [Salmonella enterica]|uniref:coenzyme F420-0:L-glutamate ligase n=1 Tax=Salmonella enterica TaxID=28901 RepID=UPI000CAB060E